MAPEMYEQQLEKIKAEADELVEKLKEIWEGIKNVISDFLDKVRTFTTNFLEGFYKKNQEMAMEKADYIGITHKLKIVETRTSFFGEFLRYSAEIRRLEGIFRRTNKHRIKKKQFARIDKLKNQALLKGIYLP